VTKFFLSFFLLIFLIKSLAAQTMADSGSIKKDTVTVKKRIILKDSVIRKMYPGKDSPHRQNAHTIIAKDDTVVIHLSNNTSQYPDSGLFRDLLLQNPYYNFYGKMQLQDVETHKASSRDGLFYLFRLFFRRYLNNLFSLFFRATMRQQQMREQALQTPLPSLLLNILFVLSSGLFACFLIRYYQFSGVKDFWLIYMYCSFFLTGIYVSKFLILKFSGWIFNIAKASDNYIFVVFMVNKILGIGLLPFLVIIAFSNAVMVDVALAISLLMIGILFIYRFIACFGTIAAEIKLNVFHYFLYLCAFEIAPLLLIYKVVLSFLKKAY
jgi:hypothetical protein